VPWAMESVVSVENEAGQRLEVKIDQEALWFSGGTAIDFDDYDSRGIVWVSTNGHRMMFDFVNEKAGLVDEEVSAGSEKYIQNNKTHLSTKVYMLWIDCLFCV